MVRHWVLISAFVGSIPTSPAILYKGLIEWFCGAGIGSASHARFCETVIRNSGESPSGKALGSDPSIRRFDPYLPSHI